jgi:hypothetical protein
MTEDKDIPKVALVRDADESCQIVCYDVVLPAGCAPARHCRRLIARAQPGQGGASKAAWVPTV